MKDVAAELGYRLPAEWEPHEAAWLAWPHERDDWPGKFAPIPWVYAEIVRHLQHAEAVHLLVNNQQAEQAARRTLTQARVDLGRIRFFRIPTDRVWTRDYGPMFVLDRHDRHDQLLLLDWHFNGWAKYPNWQRDDAVTAQVARLLKTECRQPTLGEQRVVLEGGSIDVNGAGLLLTTEECLLSPVQERNPGFMRADYERIFADWLGIRKVLWLGQGIAGDDTHGHIDDLARFVGPRTVVVVVEEDPADLNFQPLRENRQRLETMTDLDDRPLEVVPLPMPAPVWFQDQRLPASYANFYIATDRVLVPTFNDPHDRVALNTLAQLFPDRKVVGIHAVDLVWGLGTLHCLTQQQPAALSI